MGHPPPSRRRHCARTGPPWLRLLRLPVRWLLPRLRWTLLRLKTFPSPFSPFPTLPLPLPQLGMDSRWTNPRGSRGLIGLLVPLGGYVGTCLLKVELLSQRNGFLYIVQKTSERHQKKVQKR